jgi:hypothetical protein
MSKIGGMVGVKSLLCAVVAASPPQQNITNVTVQGEFEGLSPLKLPIRVGFNGGYLLHVPRVWGRKCRLPCAM